MSAHEGGGAQAAQQRGLQVHVHRGILADGLRRAVQRLAL
jgi:hypothetical protein